MTLFTSYFEIGLVSGISIIYLKFSFKQLHLCLHSVLRVKLLLDNVMYRICF